MAGMTEEDRRTQLAAQARDRLDAMRIAISRELATIPPPVPACDVDFNRLLDDRARIADELQQLRRLIEHDADETAILNFCRRSAWLGDPTQGCNPGLDRAGLQRGVT